MLERMRRAIPITAAALAMLLASCGPPEASEPRDRSLVAEVERRPWQTPYGRGESLRSEHYRIYSTAQREELRVYLPGYMEAAYEQYLRMTGLPDEPVDEPMPMYMLSGRQEWSALTEQIFGADSKALHIEAGGYCHRGICVLWDIGGSYTLSVASHEGLHQFFHHRLENKLPMWLEEGFCTLAEGHQTVGRAVRFTPTKNPSRFNALRSAIVNDRWYTIEELLPMDAGDVVTQGSEHAVGYYGQLWALAQFIQSRPQYREGLHRLMADAAAGKFDAALDLPPGALAKLHKRGRTYNRTIGEPIFRHYISDDLAGFEKEYRAYAEKLARLR